MLHTPSKAQNSTQMKFTKFKYHWKIIIKKYINWMIGAIYKTKFLEKKYM